MPLLQDIFSDHRVRKYRINVMHRLRHPKSAVPRLPVAQLDRLKFSC